LFVSPFGKVARESSDEDTIVSINDWDSAEDLQRNNVQMTYRIWIDVACELLRSRLCEPKFI